MGFKAPKGGMAVFGACRFSVPGSAARCQDRNLVGGSTSHLTAGFLWFAITKKNFSVVALSRFFLTSGDENLNHWDRPERPIGRISEAWSRHRPCAISPYSSSKPAPSRRASGGWLWAGRIVGRRWVPDVKDPGWFVPSHTVLF
ncbi:hypothetical protein GQ53DRAFT_64878 [Thozetella sp. PMI_491]|nr:hypothetical protein GQ53DRAFT_64878 [Thozetella sp. PMI_491]